MVFLKYLRRKCTEEILRIPVEDIRRLPTDNNLAKAIYSALAAVKKRREIEDFEALAAALDEIIEAEDKQRVLEKLGL